MYYFLCATIFVAGYFFSLCYITVFYHRALAHRAVVLKPRVLRFVAATGNWVTGLDPKGWVCMHRMHHAHSDTKDDPHSPQNVGIWGVLLAQLHSYERTLGGLARKNPRYTAQVRDIPFGVSWLNRRKLWFLPYLVHAAIGVVLAASLNAWLLGAAYTLGMISHPIQGWLVNAFAHANGSRNFETKDNSRNNTLVAWFVGGEGYQNNHHRHPSSAKFSYRPLEFDMGYLWCRILEVLGVLTVERAKLIPAVPVKAVP